MDEKFSLIWSFRNRFEVFKKSILSADATCPKEVDFVLVDAASSDETIRKLRELCNGISGRTVRICESSYRTSLSEAWNLGMMTTKNRYVMFASSDTMFLKSGWYEGLYEAMVNRKGEYVLIENHAVFGIDKKCIPRLGWFDEDFIAGPHFDVDYMIRASENGINFQSIGNAGFYSHGDDDETMHKRLTEGIDDRLPMNNLTNENIFQHKWLSGWPGWGAAAARGETNLPHPPTHISLVRRTRAEVDQHPSYTKKYR